MSKELMLDRRFNCEALPGSFAAFADDDSYNLYDNPIFHGSTGSANL